MKRDIFIDNNIACRFANPIDPHYKELVSWLIENHVIPENQEDDRAYLVVSNKLLNEYLSSCRGAPATNAIPNIVNKLLRDGRLIKISNKQISEFKTTYFTKTVERKLTSNAEDRNHIPVVLLSERRMALTNDEKFTYDLVNFPGFTVIVSDRPERIPYK